MDFQTRILHDIFQGLLSWIFRNYFIHLSDRHFSSVNSISTIEHQLFLQNNKLTATVTVVVVASL